MAAGNNFYLVITMAMVVTMTVAIEVPSFLKVCGTKNPKFDECVKESVNLLLPKLRKGIPELDVPPIDPLIIDRDLTFTRSDQISVVTSQLKLYNLDAYETKHLHVDLEKGIVDLHLLYDDLRLTGNYNISAKLLVSLNGYGPMDLHIKQVESKSQLKFKILPTKKGDRIYFSEMTCKLKVGSYKAKFTAIEAKDNTFADIVNSVANEQSELILEAGIPQIEDTITRIVLELSNNICKHFYREDLLPDRE